MLRHHWVGHHNPHGSIDLVAQATAGWRKSSKLLAFLQQTSGVGCYRPGWLCTAVVMMMRLRWFGHFEDTDGNW